MEEMEEGGGDREGEANITTAETHIMLPEGVNRNVLNVRCRRNQCSARESEV